MSTLRTTTDEFNFNKLPVIQSWTDFSRKNEGKSAASIFEHVKRGSYLEVKDNKFKGDSFIIIRRMDFEKLIRNTKGAITSNSRVIKCLISISETTKAISSQKDPENIQHLSKSIEQSVMLALELATINPLFKSDEEFFKYENTDNANNQQDELPSSRTELNSGVKTQ